MTFEDEVGYKNLLVVLFLLNGELGTQTGLIKGFESMGAACLLSQFCSVRLGDIRDSDFQFGLELEASVVSLQASV